MKEKLKYGLEDHVPKGEVWLYTLQHIDVYKRQSQLFNFFHTRGMADNGIKGVLCSKTSNFID